jgi:hypothetical protein
MYLVGHVQSYDTHKPVKIIVDLLKKRIEAAGKVDDAESKRKRPIKVELKKLCLVLCRSAFRTVGDSVDTAKDATTPIVVKDPDETNKEFKKRLQADNKQFGQETSLLAEMCRRLAEEKLFPDMVGYTEAITAVGPDEIVEDGLSKPGLHKHRLRVGQKTRDHDERTRKLYFVYNAADGGYMQQSEKNWVDR